MKSNGASFNTIRRVDTVGFFSDGHALAIRGLMPLPSLTACAVSLGDLSVLSWGLWRCRGKVDGSRPVFHCCHPRGAQGREHSQGWAEQGLWASGTLAQGCSPQCCYGMGHSLSLLHFSEIQEMMKDYSIIQDEVLTAVFEVMSILKSSFLYNGVKPWWLHFFTSLLDGHHSKDTQLTNPGRLCGCPVVAALQVFDAWSCVTLLVSSPCRFPVAALLGLHRHQAWGRTVRQALPWDQDNTELCFWFPKLLLFTPQLFKSWAGETKWVLEVIRHYLSTFMNNAFHSCHHLLHILGKLLGSLGDFCSRKWVWLFFFFVLRKLPFISQSLLSASSLFYFSFTHIFVCEAMRKELTLKHLF